MKSMSLRLILLLTLLVAGASLSHGQATDPQALLSESHNEPRDIVNSLIPGKPSLGKEKKSEVDPRTLQSKSVKDVRFEGSLLEMGLGSTGDPTARLEKVHTDTDRDSNAAKHVAETTEKNSNASKQSESAGDKKAPSNSTDATGADRPTKSERSTSTAATNEKPAEKEKPAAAKPDGDR